MRSTLTTLAASALALIPATAQAAVDSGTCVSQAELASLVGYALPGVLDAVSKNCAASLPADAYMVANREAMLAQYGGYKTTAWPQAKAAFLKISSDKGGKDAQMLIGALPDDALRGLVDTAVPTMVQGKIKPAQCGTIDHFARLLAPLPAQNTSELVALIAAVAQSDKPSSLRLCKP